MMEKTKLKKLNLAEKYIDNYYKNLSLLTLYKEEALLLLLYKTENEISLPFLVNNEDSKYFTRHFDSILNQSKYSFNWVKDTIPYAKSSLIISEEKFNAASEFNQLANQYKAFWAAYTQWKNRLIELNIDNNVIIPTKPKSLQERYEIYNYMNSSSSKCFKIESEDIIRMIFKNTKIKNKTYKVKLNPKLVIDLKNSIGDKILPSNILPTNFQVNEISIKKFLDVFIILKIIGLIYLIGRIKTHTTCNLYGTYGCIIKMHKNELIKIISRCTCISRNEVTSIIEYLIYNNKRIKFSDPSIQPIFQLKNNLLLMQPSILFNLNFERNFIILINKIPEERKEYLDLVHKREQKLRENIKTRLTNQSYRYVFGKPRNYKNQPDIDLAIIDEENKYCLILEIKWFLEPADPGEVVHKEEEIKKGKDQLTKIKECILKNGFIEFLKIDKSYKIGFAVVSENSIGINSNLNTIPCIKYDHLINYINKNTIQNCINWLNNFDYLPQKNKDFQINYEFYQIGKFKLKWHFYSR